MAIELCRLGFCFYCFGEAQEREHVISKYWAKKLFIEGIDLPEIIVPTCRVCNRIAGKRFFIDPRNKAEYIWSVYVRKGYKTQKEYREWQIESSSLWDQALMREPAKIVKLYLSLSGNGQSFAELPAKIRTMQLGEEQRSRHLKKPRQARRKRNVTLVRTNKFCLQCSRPMFMELPHVKYCGIVCKLARRLRRGMSI